MNKKRYKWQIIPGEKSAGVEGMQEKLAGYFALLLYAAGTVGLVWLCVRFILPWAAPFITAYLLAALLEKPVGYLSRHGWRRGAAAALCVLLTLALLLWAAAALVLKGVGTVTEFMQSVPGLMSLIEQKLLELENRAMDYIGSAPEGTAAYLETAASSIGDMLYSLPAAISKQAIAFLSRTAQASPDTLLFIVTAGIGTYFISAAFPKINAFILAQLPSGFRQRLEGLGADLRGSFGGFMRAQLILMAMTFIELLIAFLLLGVRGALGIAAVTALIDALPVFGTGVVLVPWAVFCLLLGNTGRAIGLIVCWALVNLVRSCTQAKLLGDQIGLDPIASLAAIYVGWRVCGVWGMLLFPILLVTVQQLNDRGVIRLWKSV